MMGKVEEDMKFSFFNPLALALALILTSSNRG